MPKTPLIEHLLDTLQIEVLEAHFMQCCAPWARPDEVFNDAFSRLFWVKSGEAWAEHHGRRFVLKPGSLFAIPAHTAVRFGCPHTMYFYWMHFNASVLHGTELLTFLGDCYEVAVADRAGMESLWNQLLGRLGARPGDRLARDGLVRQLLAVCLDHSDPAGHEQHVRGLVRFQAVLGHIEERLPAALTLPELAAVAHLQPTYFSTQFTRHIGERPMAYVMRRRVERAKFLLCDTSRTLAAIAEAVGFCDEYYFSRCFKRLTGITPGQFRRQQETGQP